MDFKNNMENLGEIDPPKGGKKHSNMDMSLISG